jgi:putative membrane protein
VKTQSFLPKFLIRWVVSGLGLWIAAWLLGSHGMKLGNGGTDSLMAALIAGGCLALINMFIKPLLIFLSIPALLLSLGLFMLVINGVTILTVAWVFSGLVVPNFGVAVVAGIIVGLVNYLVTRILEDIK